MQNPFSSSAGPRFVDREEILAPAQETAIRIAEDYPQVRRIDFAQCTPALEDPGASFGREASEAQRKDATTQ